MISLVVVCTPIGNLGDLSGRAAEALGAADFWIVEDTRVSGKLQAHLALKKPMHVLNDHSPAAALDRLSAMEGSAALLSDGGAPVVSDPGANLIDRCHSDGIPVDVIPGPSAVPSALILSGFYAQRFAFLGFAPRKAGDIRKLLEPFRESPLTLVLFESPFRIAELLKSAAEVLATRRYAICREITKLHQQTFRETLPTIPTERQVPRKGEITLVIEGRRKAPSEAE